MGIGGELCPPELYIKVLTPGTHERDLIGKEGLCR